jgi:hypothetical protein
MTLEAADKVLINDLVGLQKLLEQQCQPSGVIYVLWFETAGPGPHVQQELPAALHKCNPSSSVADFESRLKQGKTS